MDYLYSTNFFASYCAWHGQAVLPRHSENEFSLCSQLAIYFKLRLQSLPPRQRQNLFCLCRGLSVYFKKTKKTARIRQRKAAIWFHWSPSPLNSRVTITVNTVREITSCTTLSCIRVNGPPFSMKPILLAGTCAQYSKNATPHENRMTSRSGQLDEIFISWSFRCPYHANVMNMLDATSRSIVQIAFILFAFGMCPEFSVRYSWFSILFSARAWYFVPGRP